MIETETMASIQAQVMSGFPKDQSSHVTDQETSDFWDALAAENEALKGRTATDGTPACFDIIRD